MTNALLSPALVAATVTAGLTAGNLTTFAHTVMPALRTVDDKSFVTGFQGLDRAISNPWFLVPFTLAPLLAAASCLLTLAHPGGGSAVLVAVALVLSVTTVVITGVVHLPLNQDLGSVALAATPPELLEARAAFEHRWVLWNNVRSVTATGSFGCLVLALLRLP